MREWLGLQSWRELEWSFKILNRIVGFCESLGMYKT